MEPDELPPEDGFAASDSGPVAEPAPADSARALVQRMLDAGPWPEVPLLARIIAAGEEAVPALLELLEVESHDREGMAIPTLAIGLLSDIRSAAAVPELGRVARDSAYPHTEEACFALAEHGRAGLEILLELVRDPSHDLSRRGLFVECAEVASEEDPAGREEFLATLRDVFREIAARVGGQGDDATPANSDDENDPRFVLSHIAASLAEMADVESKDLIRAAFDRGLIDEDVISREEIDALYERGPQPSEAYPSWLQSYADSYLVDEESQEDWDSIRPLEFPSRTSYPDLRPLQEQRVHDTHPTQPMRHSNQRIGRNDPCWCGSGKKYKKCHLGQDAPS